MMCGQMHGDARDPILQSGSTERQIQKQSGAVCTAFQRASIGSGGGRQVEQPHCCIFKKDLSTFSVPKACG